MALANRLASSKGMVAAPAPSWARNVEAGNRVAGALGPASRDLPGAVGEDLPTGYLEGIGGGDGELLAGPVRVAHGPLSAPVLGYYLQGGPKSGQVLVDGAEAVVLEEWGCPRGLPGRSGTRRCAKVRGSDCRSWACTPTGWWSGLRPGP